MTSETPLRAENLRIHNKNLVLSLIYQRQSAGLSQSAVVEQTGLKAPTIFRIFNELLGDNLIEPVAETAEPEGLAKKGRKPVNFRVCRTGRYSVAVEFWTAYLSIGVFDFWGERVQSMIQNLTPEMDADEITALIIKSVSTIISKLEIPQDRIMGIGVAAPGQVDLSRNLISYYPRIKGMRYYPIVEKIQNVLHIPVILHNNCSALAVGEFRYGNFAAKDSLFTFLLRSGVNGSFIDHDSVFVNSKHRTIEVGHIPVQCNGPVCSCGQKGCLEACLRSIDTSPDGTMLFSSIDVDSEKGKQVMDEAAGYLLVAVNVISQILAPSAYLIVACNDRISAMLAERVQKMIQTDCFSQKIPDIYHALYDPLFTQRGMSDQVVARYFFEEKI